MPYNESDFLNGLAAGLTATYGTERTLKPFPDVCFWWESSKNDLAQRGAYYKLSESGWPLRTFRCDSFGFCYDNIVGVRRIAVVPFREMMTNELHNRLRCYELVNHRKILGSYLSYAYFCMSGDAGFSCEPHAFAGFNGGVLWVYGVSGNIAWKSEDGEPITTNALMDEYYQYKNIRGYDEYVFRDNPTFHAKGIQICSSEEEALDYVNGG